MSVHTFAHNIHIQCLWIISEPLAWSRCLAVLVHTWILVVTFLYQPSSYFSVVYWNVKRHLPKMQVKNAVAVKECILKSEKFSIVGQHCVYTHILYVYTCTCMFIHSTCTQDHIHSLPMKCHWSHLVISCRKFIKNHFLYVSLYSTAPPLNNVLQTTSWK